MSKHRNDLPPESEPTDNSVDAFIEKTVVQDDAILEHGTDAAPSGTLVADGAQTAEGTLDEPTVAHIDRAIILGQDGRWLAGWALRFIIIVVAGYLLRQGLGIVWTALLPIIMALLVSTVLWPPVAWLRARKVPGALAAASVLLGFFAIIGGLFSFMAPSVASQSKDLARETVEGIRQLESWVKGPPLNFNLEALSEFIQKITTFIQNRLSDIAGGVFSGLATAGSIVVTCVLLLLLTFFMLKDGPGFLPMVRRMTGPNVGWHLTELFTRIWNTLSGFIRTQAIVSLIDAVFIGIGLLILDVPLAFVLAVITFVAGFIPIVGAFTAGALAIIIALVSNGATNALFVLILIVIVQQLEGNVLQPMLQSRAMNLHAAVVLLAVALGSSMFGVIGAFLSVPIAATLAIMIRYHQELVALRAGEITFEDITLSTSHEALPTKSHEAAFKLFSEKLSSLGGSTHDKEQ
ncbi:AI-2E family transporter [Corynebacterium sp. HS2168-gen11]|uniref:AI-2E family transporter n=1 Tax=Corynebacterium sp. HS2168-gen11 TaxID=2974027 RepID=UPI00216AC0C3|nr:AI-2E family transporter [Corynebacterium sp. HS2168-gen11]MCS4536010.1 AI-2E family transporter [Corynebacterium sp. HS2168-gen11]